MTTKQDVLACYEETGTMIGVSQKLGISPQTVRRVLISNGIFPSKRVKEMTRLRMMGLTDDDIAKYLRVQKKTVKNIRPTPGAATCWANALSTPSASPYAGNARA